MKRMLMTAAAAILLLAALTAAGEELPDFLAVTGISGVQARLDAGAELASVMFREGIIDEEGPAESSDPAVVNALWEALSRVRIAGESDCFRTDWYPAVIFTLSDGTSLTVRFDWRWLETDGFTFYVLENDEDFWHLARELYRSQYGYALSW
ncbi:MAG: hypothetical protein IJK28_07595 [Clostridia bacterium]|nr:hypothetical protein [Clostridia bacterium]